MKPVVLLVEGDIADDNREVVGDSRFDRGGSRIFSYAEGATLRLRVAGLVCIRQMSVNTITNRKCVSQSLYQ